MSHKRNENPTPKDEMATPPSLYKKLDDRFHFDFDAAANEYNTLCGDNWLQNALEDSWMTWGGKMFYCNPPYSNPGPFVKKGYLESLKGATVVMLLPVDFSTVWWDWCMNAAEWIRIKGRIHFHGIDGLPTKGSPLFDSVVVVFDAAERKKNGGIKVTQMGWK